jgi:hypothetical protein
MISNTRISRLLHHEGTKNTNLLFFVTLVLRPLVDLACIKVLANTGHLRLSD